jgi:N-acetylneuraminic acid mutarotase
MMSTLIAHAIASTSASSFDPKQSSIWSLANSMPTPRSEFMAEAIDNKIYVIGGADYSQGEQKDMVEVYNNTIDRWETVKPLPIALDHGATASYNGKIYVVGGFLEGKVPTDKLFIYNPNEDEWIEGKPLPSARGALAAEFVNGTLYAFGGLNSSQTPVTTNWAYDPRTDSWSEKAPMPTARHHLASTAVDGKIYAIGGRILGNGVPSEDLDEAVSNFNNNEMYDPETDSWTTYQPMLTKRSGFAATAANGDIYVFGGQGVDGLFDSVEKYEPSSNKWTYEQPMPFARMGMEAETIDDKIYVIGGQILGESGLVSLDTNEVLDINGDTIS